MSYVLAIDVGTSFTAAALVKPGQGPIPAPEILSLGLHGSAVPSVLFYADDGRVLVGEAAERRGLDDPRRMVREFKRRIGDSVPLAVGDSWLAPEDVYARMARWVVDRAEEREGSAPSSIIMTHPAAWGQHRTSLVLSALNVAGLQDITLISEPEAAALHYASQTRVEDGSIVAVYDLGGGTFDTAVLRKAGAGNFELLGRPDGIETLGGADFDAAVLRHVMGHLGEGAALDASSPETLAALSRLRRECREAKEALSLDSEASVAVSLPGTQLSVRLVRSEFEAMIEAPVRDTVDALQRSLRSINLEAQDLSAVLLIGGSSRIPLVAELISVELDRPIAVDADPKSSICLGAAVAGLRPSGSSAVDAASTASALASAAEESSAVDKSAAAALGRPHVPDRAPAFNHLKAASAKPGRHAPRARVRMAAAAAAAATVLTIATATAAQSPEGTGLLATVFGNQAADVMRDGGAQAAGAAQASGAGAGSTPVIGGPAAGLEASAKTGVTRAGSNGRAPARQNATNPGTANAGTGSAANGSGNTAGTGAGGTSSGTAAGGTGGTTTPAAPGTGTSTPGTQAPGTQTPPPATTPPTTPEPDPTGGAASGPTPPPATTTPPPVTTDPTTPPVVEPTTPPVTPTDPGTPPPPPPSPEPTVPQPEPTVVQDPPPSPDPVLPQETTPPAVPDPIPTETSPTPDPALLSAV
jgi:molecular chaperone DnaK